MLKWLPEAKLHADSPCLSAASPRGEEWEQLAGIPGLDPERGLATMRGNVAKYRAVLKMFADACRQHAASLPGMLASGEVSGIEAVACSLCGNAAMLGVPKVSAAAGAVVSACRSGAGAGASGAALLEELTRLAGAIQGAIPAAVAITTPEFDSAELADVMARLEKLIEHGNIEANYLARDNVGLLRAALGKSARTFLANLEAFDYESALAALRQSIARLDGGAGN